MRDGSIPEPMEWFIALSAASIIGCGIALGMTTKPSSCNDCFCASVSCGIGMLPLGDCGCWHDIRSARSCDVHEDERDQGRLWIVVTGEACVSLKTVTSGLHQSRTRWP